MYVSSMKGYDKSEIIQLNDVYQASKTDNKAKKLTKNIEYTAQKK